MIKSGLIYTLHNVHTPNSCLDLSGDDNKSIIGYPYHGYENQKWRFIQSGSGWLIQSFSSGKYLGYEGQAKNGVRLVTVPNAYEWNVKRDDKHKSGYRISGPNTSFDVDLSDNGNAAPRTPVQIWSKWEPGLNQLWTIKFGECLCLFELTEDLIDLASPDIHSFTRYKIINHKTGTVVDLSDRDQKSIVGYRDLDGGNQYWIIEDTGSGWTLKSGSSGTYIGIDKPSADGVHLVARQEPFKWDIKLDDTDPSIYRFSVPHTNYYIDLADHGNAADDTPVQIWSRGVPGINQTWAVQQAGTNE